MPWGQTKGRSISLEADVLSHRGAARSGRRTPAPAAVADPNCPRAVLLETRMVATPMLHHCSASPTGRADRRVADFPCTVELKSAMIGLRARACWPRNHRRWHRMETRLAPSGSSAAQHRFDAAYSHSLTVVPPRARFELLEAIARQVFR